MSVIISEPPRPSEFPTPTNAQIEKASRLLDAMARSHAGKSRSACEREEIAGRDAATVGSSRTVIVAREVGFCFGVKRAINLTRKSLAESENVFILGDLIHNKHVTDRLASEGLCKAADLEAEHGGTMVIRAYGHSRGVDLDMPPAELAGSGRFAYRYLLLERPDSGKPAGHLPEVRHSCAGGSGNRGI